MEIRPELDAVAQTGYLLLRPVFLVHELIRNEDHPLRKRRLQRRDPFPDTGFAAVDLLSSSYKAYHDCPVLVPVEAGEEELRLGPPEVPYPLLALHEVDGHGAVPCALRLIEDRDVLGRWILAVAETLV